MWIKVKDVFYNLDSFCKIQKYSHTSDVEQRIDNIIKYIAVPEYYIQLYLPNIVKPVYISCVSKEEMEAIFEQIQQKLFPSNKPIVPR